MAYTDFTKYSHAQLRTMAEALDPGAVMAAGDPWRRAADTLKAIRATLTRASTEAAVTWEGATSDAFHTRMLHLADGINNAASYANDAANTLHAMSEAIAKAKRDMPEEPSTWEQAKDTLGDGISSVFGGDDEHLPLADRRKTEAATVMQTLAMHYRIATPALKPPQSLPPALGGLGESRDVVPQDDPSGVAAMASAMVSGTSLGMAGTSARVPSGPVPQGPASPEPQRVARPAPVGAPVVTDPGIKGGKARPQGPTGSGMGVPAPAVTGIRTDAGAVPPGIPRNGYGGTPLGGTGLAGTSTAGPSASGPSGPGVGPGGRGPVAEGLPEGVGPVGGFGARGGWAAGGGAVPGAAAGGRAVPGERSPQGASARSGGVVGGTTRPVEGGRGTGAFTEGGSGLGARSGPRGETGVGGPGAVAPGAPVAGTHRRTKDGEKRGRRPVYLVEDEETWASARPANPNVVE
ncbi:hypothetical protein [Kitasatospora sp. NPDC048538]|uniref:WXG100 family type VII secretion target n=1 Tax=unclassified Kitasatospora TaxID=2633591 RepID=UPI0033D92186